MDKCIWRVRPGTLQGTFFAYTPCKPGFNYLSKIKIDNNKSDEMYIEDIKNTYDNCECPIYGKPIKVDCSILLM